MSSSKIKLTCFWMGCQETWIGEVEYFACFDFNGIPKEAMTNHTGWGYVKSPTGQSVTYFCPDHKQGAAPKPKKTAGK